MTKITELPQTTTMAVSDLLAIVTNPGTSPVTQKIVLSDLSLALPVGTGPLGTQLAVQAAAESYQQTSTTYFADGAVSSATVVWQDGSAGVFTTTTHNLTWAAVDAYTITHTSSGKTVTQSLVTRDGTGRVTVKPVLTVAP